VREMEKNGVKLVMTSCRIREDLYKYLVNLRTIEHKDIYLLLNEALEYYIKNAKRDELETSGIKVQL
jgi:hypothetical protein